MIADRYYSPTQYVAWLKQISVGDEVAIESGAPQARAVARVAQIGRGTITLEDGSEWVGVTGALFPCAANAHRASQLHRAYLRPIDYDASLAESHARMSVELQAIAMGFQTGAIQLTELDPDFTAQLTQLAQIVAS